MQKWIYYIVFVALFTVSCKKEIISDNPPYIEQWRDKYCGSYTVYDTANGTTYQMEIIQLNRRFENNIFIDSILISNYGNKFSFVLSEIQDDYSPAFGLPNLFPKLDKNNHRWSFSGGMIWNDDMDTLKIHSTISNIAFYLEDGVPVYDCNCADLAVKIE